MTGIDILKRVKENEHLKRTPVVVLTTTDDEREIKRCYDLGANVYITKPVNYESFANAIRQLGLFFSVIQVPEPPSLRIMNMPKSVLYADDEPGAPPRLVERGLDAQGVQVRRGRRGRACRESSGCSRKNSTWSRWTTICPRLDGMDALQRIHGDPEPSAGDHRHRRAGFGDRRSLR